MKSLKKALLYGFFIWLIPFVVAFLIYPVRTSNRLLFESIMPVVLTACVVAFADLYFAKVEKNFFKEGVLLGLLWFAMAVVIDLLMFREGPMKMSFIDYMADIGLTYLIIPVVTMGFGHLNEKKK
ncbi:hypothetical protein HY991_04150 [Candidatus Micrarchaeota archaeon]|nr:hypothetical protein [Candidatus Micrarchaeota archaeon]